MKNKLLFLVFLISSLAFSQDFQRFNVSGKIIVESSDLGGITVFNASANTGTITNDHGEFTLAVRLNDVIEVSALQFQNIKFNVNEAIVGSKSMKLFLIVEINKLDEIILLPQKLSGNLAKDMEVSKPFEPKLDALYYGIKHKDEFEFASDYSTKTVNDALGREHMPMVNGLNVVNVVDQLLLPLFRSKIKNKKEKGIPEVPIEAVKYYFGSEFLVDNFNIPEHRVEEFINYVQRNNFDFSLLNEGKEMAFLELLNAKSVAFLNAEAKE
ncbi:hypothetical protein [Algibacter sp. L1A34]|uniref:hypothetical protein n=1 Tax=Algibacter sp. L1A34 TaxID=2686365 RepID=UPI00131AE33F|nr:hypothetical protein [Algibacter sp. L1A34]